MRWFKQHWKITAPVALLLVLVFSWTNRTNDLDAFQSQLAPRRITHHPVKQLPKQFSASKSTKSETLIRDTQVSPVAFEADATLISSVPITQPQPSPPRFIKNKFLETDEQLVRHNSEPRFQKNPYFDRQTASSELVPNRSNDFVPKRLNTPIANQIATQTDDYYNKVSNQLANQKITNGPPARHVPTRSQTILATQLTEQLAATPPPKLAPVESQSNANLTRYDLSQTDHQIPVDLPVRGQLRAPPNDLTTAQSNHDEAIEHDPQTRHAALTEPILDGGPSTSTQGTTDYRLASQPKLGDRYKSETPVMDRRAHETEAFTHDFSPDPIDAERPYDPYLNQSVYEQKTLNANQRPLLELGRPWYQLGQLPEGSSLLGFHNNLNPQLIVFGDYRQAFATNTVDGDNTTQAAFELNTFWHLGLTSTERLVWGIAPLDGDGGNTRWRFDDDRFDLETDFDFDFGYFEGDLGAIAGGLTGKTLPFDAPFAIGHAPIFIQNGIWFNDAVEGAFFTIPARNSPKLGISNMDITFGFIWDQIDSGAFPGDNSAAKAYTVYSFIEALNGYIELDYAFLEDRSPLDRSYHNISLAYTRRWGRLLSQSTRVIVNAGQDVTSGPQTADGALLLLENSLITRNPYTVIPYFNFFAGFDTPQSVAGDGELVNTGILFESDGLTGSPTLDARANDTFGGAIGLNLLAQDFSQQLILEVASVFRGDDTDLAGDQYGVGMRYQIPLSNSWIFRTDAMYGFFRNDTDDFGFRVEMRKKF